MHQIYDLLPFHKVHLTSTRPIELYVAQALTYAKMIKAGTVSVNCYSEGDISTPFGGYKQSGFGGRDNGVKAFDQYTETKTIWVDLTS